ncbi:uncharacterized protein [Lolium perenne]|uniref:uncharacterized protein n=1 Tax=Lolium perenne TaxID=4522 RepID=UPI003A996F44
MSTPSSNPFVESSIPDPGQLRAVAITDHVPVKLSTTAANYLAWKTYFYLLFHEYNLRDHIEGIADLLACDSDWLAIDATIIRWLFLTVSPDIFKTVVREGDDARTVWGKINGLFTNNKLQRVVFLQKEVFGTPQGDQALDAYCMRLKAISDELQDLGFWNGDELLLSTLTAGLNEDLSNAASNLTLMTNPTFERAVDYLRLEERRLKGVRTRAVHTALWAIGNSVLPHGGGAPPAPTPAPPHLAPQPPQHQGGGGGGRGRRRGHGDGRSGGNNGGPGIVGPRPGTVSPRPPTHQVFIAAPPLATVGLPYAPAYGGMILQAPTAHWDPALYTTLQYAPSPGAYSGGGDWFIYTGASAHMAAHPVSPHLVQDLVSVKTLSRDNFVTVEFDEFGFSVKDARTRMFGRPILALQTDNDKEFDNITIRTLLSTHGTIFRLTCPYTSQQNGRTERVLCTLNDCVCTLLFHAHMPPSSSAASQPYLGGGPWLGSAPACPLYYSCDASRDALKHCLGLTRGAVEPRLGRCRLALDTARVSFEHCLRHRRVIRVLDRIALEPQLGRCLASGPAYASSAAGNGPPHARPCGDSHPEHAWLAAMQDEFDALQRNQTWTFVPCPPHANIITGKWVFKHKFHPDGTLDRHKARWVVRGFRQRVGVDFTDTFAPVVKPGTIRTVLQLAVSRAWPVHQMDVSKSFLHGHLEEQVFCQQPTGFVDSTDRIVAFLHQLGFRSTRSDASMFVYNNGATTAYLLLYVDDDIILTASSMDLLRQLTERLRAEFARKDLGLLHYFLGIEVVCRTDDFFLHQRKYAHELLDRAGMLNCKPTATPVDTKSKLSAIDGSLATDASSYRSIIGALQYLTLTRPELQYVVQQMCLHMHAPRDPNWAAVKRILRFIRCTMDFGLSLHASTTTNIVAYSDVDWAGCPDTRRSTYGYCVYFGPSLIS